jgi:preprotein translocase subunit SecF
VGFFREKQWDLVGRRRIGYGLSAVVIVAGIVCMAVLHFNLGIDFTGGGLVKIGFDSAISQSSSEDVAATAKVRAALQRLDVTGAQVLLSEGTQLIIRTPLTESATDEQAARQAEAILAEVRELFPGAGASIIGRERVGPVVGAELKAAALKALAVGMIAILLYVMVRYDFRFAVAAIVALLHDVLVQASAVTVFRVELDVTYVPALLTVVGYSINDSVVIFDRVRENMRIHKRAPFEQIVNASLLQTLARSINTSLTTLFTLVALFVLGGPTIHNFAFAMIVGIITGSYSSIFVAAPFVVSWRKWVEKKVSAPVAVGPTPAPAAAAAGGGEAEDALPRDASATAEAPTGIEAVSAAADEQAREERRERRKQRKAKAKRKPGQRKKRF